VKAIWLFALAVVMGLPVCACQRSESTAADADVPEVVPVVENIDTRSRPGRMFMYTDAHGKLVKTSSYADIPEDRRSTVVVLEQGLTSPSPKNPSD
jgi:hypothetical protein